ncbi:MAG TPA: type I methionyl aminopeptidase [Anaerolineales bacterium]|nr:type I methionyl aminopeptidase [Anaerolineales bacterium]
MPWKRGISLKTPDELAIMREAGRINARALAAARAVIRPGVTTADISEAAAEVIRKHGAQPAFLGYGEPPFPAVTTVSVNDELVHGIPGKRKLREGDIVSVDCGTVFEGYVGDSAFSMGLGSISTLAEKLLRVTEAALKAGIEKMVDANRTGDVSAAIQEVVERAGFHVVRDYTGHGVGRAMHEDPQVPNYGQAGRGVPLREGMTIALEPMVLVGTNETAVLDNRWTVVSADGSLTAHFEHTVAVTADGPLILTLE